MYPTYGYKIIIQEELITAASWRDVMELGQQILFESSFLNKFLEKLDVYTQKL